MCETSCQSRFDARYWMLGAGALRRPRGMVWGGRREEGSGWGTHVYLWQIHFDIWQYQYNIVKLKKKKKKKEKKAIQLKSVRRLITNPAFSTNNLSVKVITLLKIIYNLEQFSQSLY